MGAPGRDGPGPSLGTVPAGSHGREFTRPAGGTARGWLHVRRVVAGWKMDVSHLRDRRSFSHLAATFSGWTAGASDLRTNGGGGHRHGARWPLLRHSRRRVERAAIGRHGDALLLRDRKS